MTKHDFRAFGWDNYDCIHCDISGYVSKHEYCEDEPNFANTAMARLQRANAETAKHTNPLLALIAEKKA